MGPPPCPLSPCPSWPGLDVFACSLLDVPLWSESSLARLGLLDTSSNTQRQSANRQMTAMIDRKKNLSSHSGWLKCTGQPQTGFKCLISALYVHIFIYSEHHDPVFALLFYMGLNHSRWGSAHPDACLSPPTLYPDQLVWPLNSIEVLMLSFYYL